MSNEQIAKLEGQIEALIERVTELEAAVFLDGEFDDIEIDLLESQYQQFAAGVRSRREGNA